MTMHDRKPAYSKPLRDVNKFSLLRRLSLSSLVAMLITAAVMILLYRQDQIAEHNVIAAQANEHTLHHLADQFGEQFDAFVASTRGLDDQALKVNPGVDVLLSKMGKLSEQPWLKLKIYDSSGKIILSSAKEEIGRTSNHPDAVEKALSGEVKSRIVFRESFRSSTGEMHDVYVAKTYMPLNYAGKRIGVIKIYRDVSPIFERIQVNTIKIASAVCIAFTMLYAALFFAVFRADRAVAEWQRIIAEGEESLRESQLIAGLGSFVLDITTGLWKSSEVLDQLFGIDRADEHSVGQWMNLVHPDDRAMMSDYLENEIIGKGCAFDKQFRIIRHNDQAERWMYGLGKLKYDALGHPCKLHGTLQDITERKAAEEEIRSLAFYDHLTRLPNRRLLMDRLEQAQAFSARNGREGALLFIDLDNFKNLNDRHGHDMGDLLLQQVAQRLTSCIREGDTAARLGGDEFVVMLEGLSENIVEAVAEAEAVGNKILAALNQTYQLATHEYHSTPSIGATMFNGHTQTIEELLRQADLAMYQSKKEGRNTLRFFIPTV